MLTDENIIKIHIDFIVRYYSTQFFLEGCWIGELRIAAGSHISTDHDTIDCFRGVRHRHIDHQNPFAVLAQEIPDRLPSLALRLHVGLTSDSRFLLLVVSPEIIDAMPCGL